MLSLNYRNSELDVHPKGETLAHTLDGKKYLRHFEVPTSHRIKLHTGPHHFQETEVSHNLQSTILSSVEILSCILPLETKIRRK